MAGEIVEGKRTFIERNGHEFELPDQHTADLEPYDGAQTIALHTPGAGGTYWVRSVDEEADRVVVHVGDPLIETGQAGAAGEGQPLPEVTGYPFPDS